MADERVVATKLEQIEQFHGELLAKQRTITREQTCHDHYGTSRSASGVRLVAEVPARLHYPQLINSFAPGVYNR